VQLPLRLGLPKVMPGLRVRSSAVPSTTPAADTPVDLTTASFTSLPRIPCASVLIRIQVQRLSQSVGSSVSIPATAPTPDQSASADIPSVVSLDTRALESAISPPPLYSDGSYDSTAATPAGSEVSM
jgi:hypothetical protein